MSEYYDLNDQPCTMEEWVEIMRERRDIRRQTPDGFTTPDQDPTRIGYTIIGDSQVSTVWLGLNHSLPGYPPTIYETLVFGGDWDQEMRRYHNREAAKLGHDYICDMIRAGQKPPE